MVCPFSPIDIHDTNIEIPKEYLNLHDYQKRIKDTATNVYNKAKDIATKIYTGDTGMPPNVKKILDQTLETTAKGIQQGIPEGITEVAQGGQEFLTQIAFNNYCF